MDARFETLAYRLTTVKWAKVLDGSGAAKRDRNRWNDVGQYVTYTTSSRALAVLESRVHSPVGPPRDSVFVKLRLSFPECEVHTIARGDLPEGWRDPERVGHCQIRGSNWYAHSRGQYLLVVPSAIVPYEQNYIIRGGNHGIEILDIEPIDLDPRLWESDRDDEVYSLLP